MQIREIDPVKDPLWSDLVTSTRTDVFHSPEWSAVLAEVYGFDLRARVTLDSGRPRAGVVWAEIDDVFGPRRVSLPFSDFCDPVVSDLDEWKTLTDGLLDGPVPFRARSLRSSEPGDDHRLDTTGRFRWHRISIDRPLEELWSRIDASARRAVRRAESSGVTVRSAESHDDLRSFFELHLRVRKSKYRLLAQPYGFMTEIWDRFVDPGNGSLVLAEVEGRVVAGVLFLEWGDTMYYKFNASDPDYLEHRPNDAIMWEGMRQALDRGLAYVDLGVTDWDQDGLIRYKQKYADTDGVVTAHAHSGDPPTPAADRMRAALPQLTDLLTRPDVPDDVSERAGDLLYRYFT